MLEYEIRNLLEKVQEKRLGVEAALEQLKTLPFTDLGFAKVDHHRALRKGFPEVILCLGKTPSQIRDIARSLFESGEDILATRADAEAFKAIKEIAPQAIYYKEARLVMVKQERKREAIGQVLVVAAGSSDLPVAEEAALTAEIMESSVDRLYDIGVAGLHRLLAYKESLFKARVIIAVAGMEGALPSIIGGLVASPVIAVPTSIGYGASFQGLAALLTMLNTCAPGVAVVNIDNGFGAGYLAALINKMVSKGRGS